MVDDDEGDDNFNPAISDDEDKKEYFDTAEELDRYKHCLLYVTTCLLLAVVI